MICMKEKDECIDLLASNVKDIEKALGLTCRNGQTMEAVRKTLAWVLK